MELELRSIGEQVVVITGSDSGIGLATARMACRAGARVVLNSRDGDALERIAGELRESGGEAAWHAADVADEAGMRRLAEVAVETFGRIDTWVNNAGVTVFGEIEKIPVNDARRVFETNYFGVVNGTLAALPHLRRQGGVLINVGSVLSGVAIPLQGHYTASKHAIKGFTDSLRQELEHGDAPVAVTLIRPASIDTPYTEHAHNHMEGAEPAVPPPVYAPEVVARAILDCAERPQREVLVGGSARQMEMMAGASRSLYDWFTETMVWDQQRAEPGSTPRNDALYGPSTSGSARGSYDGHVMHSSMYTRARQHPVQALMGVGAVGAGLYLLTRTAVMDRLTRS